MKRGLVSPMQMSQTMGQLGRSRQGGRMERWGKEIGSRVRRRSGVRGHPG